MQFRSLGHAENIDDYRLIMNLNPKLNQRIYNAPIMSEEVEVVWVEGNEYRNKLYKKKILHGNNNKIHNIKS
jgi:hypothetical protein